MSIKVDSSVEMICTVGGWIFVGVVTEVGDKLLIKDARCVHKYKTEKGGLASVIDSKPDIGSLELGKSRDIEVYVEHVIYRYKDINKDWLTVENI